MIENLLPITQELLTEWHSDTYYYIYFIRNLSQIENIWYKEETREFECTLDILKKGAVFEASGVSYQTILKKWKKFLANTISRPGQTIYRCETNHYMCFMPFAVWDVFADEMAVLKSKTRNIYTRVFLYVYMSISAFNNQWGHSVEAIARELEMDHSTVSEIMIWLEKHGFIERSNYYAQKDIPRNYFLPKELWTDARIHEEEIMKSQKVLVKP